MTSQRLREAQVRDHMSRRLVVLAPDMEIVKATHILIRNGISAAPVVDGQGALLGILTERDVVQNILQAGYYETPREIVRDRMTPDPEFVAPDDSIFDLASRLVTGPYRRFPVVENNRVVGMISRCDVMRAIGQYYRK